MLTILGGLKMIYLIHYRRTIGDKTYDKTATFITKETRPTIAYYKWLKQHTENFMNSISACNITEKYPRRDTLDNKRERLGMFISVPEDRK
jgi:hypothetical protein